jgi:hypothetical protein
MDAPVTLALATGAVTAANELFFAPNRSGTWRDLNWRVLPAAIVWAGAIGIIGSLSPRLALGLAVTGLLTASLASFGKSSAPVINIAKTLGYGIPS